MARAASRPQMHAAFISPANVSMPSIPCEAVRGVKADVSRRMQLSRGGQVTSPPSYACSYLLIRERVHALHPVRCRQRCRGRRLETHAAVSQCLGCVPTGCMRPPSHLWMCVSPANVCLTREGVHVLHPVRDVVVGALGVQLPQRGAAAERVPHPQERAAWLLGLRHGVRICCMACRLCLWLHAHERGEITVVSRCMMDDTGHAPTRPLDSSDSR
jgi:hypothetical protein